MEKTIEDPLDLGDQTTRDVMVCLRSRDGKPESFHCNSNLLKKKSRYLSERLSENNSGAHIEIPCSGFDYDHYAKVLKLLHLPEEQVLETFDSVRTALGILQVSLALHCNEITKNCVQYLEAVPWDDKEEEELIKIVPALGPEAAPILARLQPVAPSAAKSVFLSAIRFASAIDTAFPPFTDELKTSAQEQLEYMLVEDEDTLLVTVDEEVRSTVRTSLARVVAMFKNELLIKMPSDFDNSPEVSDQRVSQSLSDLEWMCNILSRMEMMGEFVESWIQISDQVLACIGDVRYGSGLWTVKAKLLELTGKALDAVGYGHVVLPSPMRLQLLKTWLPYMTKTKPLLDEFLPYKMDSEHIEAAVVSLILSLPSGDQAEVLEDWLKRREKQLKFFPDLSEAFEVWCYRTKSAKRRLFVGFNGDGNPTVNL